jgi:predicted PurR-regulated permease PerM
MSSVSDPSPLAQRRRRQVFAAVTLSALAALLVTARAMLLPFVLGALLAYVLDPVVDGMMRIRVGARGVPRWVAVLVIYITLITTLVVTSIAVVPRLVGEVRSFATIEVPSMRRRAESTWIPRVTPWVDRLQRTLGSAPQPAAAPVAPANDDDGDGHPDPTLKIEPVPGGGYRVHLPPSGVEVTQVDEHHYRAAPVMRRDQRNGGALQEQLRRLGAGHVGDIVRIGRGVIGGVIGGIFAFFMTLMISAYLLVTEAKIFGFLRSLFPPESREAFDEYLRNLDRGLSGVVRGQLIICAVNGALSAVGFALAELKYWPTLAAIATAFSIIPIFGTILSSAPAVLLGLTQSFGTGIFVLLWIIGIHQLEANLLNPKIMGDSAKIHPVLVVFSLLAGEHLGGILGALLAVPVMSIAQTTFLHWRKYALAYGDPPRNSELP